MSRTLASLVFAFFLAACLTGGAPAAFAQSTDKYPDHPIRLVVPWPAGGSSDATARIVGAKLAESLGQPVIIDNRAGASGIIGTDFVAKAPKDGYTLLWAISNHITNPMLYKQVPYDPMKDFEPIAVIGYTPFMLVVNPDLPVKTIKELVDYAKAHPGKVTYATPGHGTSHHLGMQLFSNLTGVEMLHVPYKGGAPAIADLLAGRVNVAMEVLSTVEPLVKTGKLRALAVTTPQRVPLVPDVPTVAEQGYPSFELVGYWGLMAPAGTPREVVAKLAAETNKALAREDTKESLRSLAMVHEPAGSSPAKFRSFLEAQVPKYTKLIKDAGVVPQ
ncbi:MAG: tripartite tricarboxylate transporter substrate binding protein [Rhodospirillaceae bacterium]|nr:tripartite tricarboxylate transporter substrate binding protein [Rhodospirillaceae bacterium]